MTTLTRSVLFALVILLALTAVAVAVASAAPAPAPEPATCPVISVNARSGDSVASIARRYGTTSAAIVSANPGHDLTPLMVGQTISVPACQPARPRWFSRLVAPRSRS